MSSRNDDIRAAVIDSLADDSDDCPVCGSADVSNAAGPIRSGQWWYRCRGCGFDRFGPAREPVRGRVHPLTGWLTPDECRGGIALDDGTVAYPYVKPAATLDR